MIEIFFFYLIFLFRKKNTNNNYQNRDSFSFYLKTQKKTKTIKNENFIAF